MDTPAPPPSTADPLPFEPTRDIRFAVVMYGGVSLAIYINGIAQELLHMVRATAADPDTGPPRTLTPVEKVYREVGRIANARFVVDILSGTSAGGINAIYLAKALVNDQALTQLKQLWITEGDIAKLINDATSTQGTGLPRPDAPEALLNGQRMYQKLVSAFEGMDATAQPRDPLVSELDLFVTTTDIAGVPLPLRLADRIVYERRHRGMFHFRYRPPHPQKDGETGTQVRQPKNDFTRDDNPFLAFAARSTSAFPFAFEPMRLTDVDAVLETLDGYRGSKRGRSDDVRWKPFMERFTTPEGTAFCEPRDRSFGDGGYLDNKPFSYAVDALLQRESNLSMERKLVYVEPKPEHPERDPAPTRRPDAIENVLAATVGLPRYETIREDLERVMSRNRLTERVRLFTRELERDVVARETRQTFEPADVWGSRYLDEMVRDHGLAYGGYHRLRVAAVSDWIALVLARARDLPDGSDHQLAVRQLVGEWRSRHYSIRPDGGCSSENEFLLDFDLAFRLRRVKHLLGKATWLHRVDTDPDAAGTVTRIARQAPDGLGTRALTPHELAEFRNELRLLRNVLVTAHARMSRTEEALELRGTANPLRGPIDALGLTGEHLTEVLHATGKRERERTARRLLSEPARPELLDELAAMMEGDPARPERLDYIVNTLREEPSRADQLVSLTDELRAVVLDARRSSTEAVRALRDPASSPARQLARQVLWHYYTHYPDYDMVSFPILYSTEAGEQETVDVIRISPEEAKFVFDEETDPRGRRKLAGTALFSFGGFLRDSWRANDILWGRLDGAERIICTALPGDRYRKDRDRLLTQVSVAILQEELGSASRAQISGLMSQTLLSLAAGRAPESAAARVRARVAADGTPARLDGALRASLKPAKLLEHFQRDYEVDRNVDPALALQSMARGSRVVGRMLEGISARRSLEGTGVRWVTRAGSWFWGLVQVAVPRSLPSMLFDHWLGLLYSFAVLLVVVGVVAGGAGTTVLRWGLGILGGLLAVHVAVLLLRDTMLGRRGAVRTVLLLAAGALAVAGAAWVAREGLPAVAAWVRGGELFAWWWDTLLPLRVLSVALGLAIVSFSLLPLATGRWRPLPGGFSSPMLAAEFPADGAALEKLSSGVILPTSPVDTCDKQRDAREDTRRKHRGIPAKILRDLRVDYGFIAAYWVLFILFANRLTGIEAGAAGGFPAWLPLVLGSCAAVAGTLAALVDVAENLRIREAFTTWSGMAIDEIARGIRTAARWKWALAFATVLLLSPLFLTAAQAHLRILFAWWVLVGVAGLAGAMRWHRLLEWVFPALGVGLLAAGWLLRGG